MPIVCIADLVVAVVAVVVVTNQSKPDRRDAKANRSVDIAAR